MTWRRVWPLPVLALLAGWAMWSWTSGGLIALLLEAEAAGGETLEDLRQFFARVGPLAPLLYVAAVTVEVLVAPLPGVLLHAPAGAIFGGLLGGTLALIGNVLGAALAAWLAGTIGGRWMSVADRPRLASFAERVRKRGVVVILLLRINPLTSSDLVSYAAGLAGVPPWRVALGTAVGIAPLCYAQAYASEWVFRTLPGAAWLIVPLAVVAVLLMAWWLFKGTLSKS